RGSEGSFRVFLRSGSGGHQRRLPQRFSARHPACPARERPRIHHHYARGNGTSDDRQTHRIVRTRSGPLRKSDSYQCVPPAGRGGGEKSGGGGDRAPTPNSRIPVVQHGKVLYGGAGGRRHGGRRGDRIGLQDSPASRGE